ncbi:MAG: pilus assembly protein TadG-related protein [Phototrophicaceae bacterium]
MRKPILHRAAEQGQAIVLIAALMVVLIASVGLAIDGGGLFLLYRDVQNATDAAALTSAFSLCTGDNVEEAGARSATLNGFTDGFNDATVIIENPPVTDTPTSNAYLNDDDYVFIRITAQKPSYFIQVVYPGDLGVAAQTISRCSGGADFGWPPNSATISLSRGCAASNGSANTGPNRATGGGYYQTVGGGIYSNSSGCGAGAVEANGNGATIKAGGYGICTQGGTINPGTGTIEATEGGATVDPVTGNPIICPVPQIMDDDPLGSLIPVPNCAPGSKSLSTGTNSPGTYSSFDTNSGIYTLEPGIYCITDGDVSWKATLRTDNPSLVPGAGVFLYFQNAYRVRNTGNDVNLQLYAIQDESSDYAGLLMWWADTGNSNSDALNFTAQSQGALTGTIYAPYKHCNLSGQAGLVLYGQFICYSFDNNGGSGSIIYHEPSLVYRIPPAFGIIE